MIERTQCGSPVEHHDTGSTLLCHGLVELPYLREEVDAIGDCVHSDRVSSDKEASKIHSGQVVEFGIQTGQLPNVITNHVK